MPFKPGLITVQEQTIHNLPEKDVYYQLALNQLRAKCSKNIFY